MFIKKVIISHILLLTIALNSCSGDGVSKNNNREEDRNKNQTNVLSTLEKGKIHHQVILPNTSDGISVFLPKTKKSFPILVFFDSEKRGILPVKKYQAIADELGIGLIGSNVVENGYPYTNIQQHFLQIKDEVKKAFPESEKRLYVSGFSGGSRVAAWISFDFNLPILIGCAAGVAEGNNQMIAGKYYYGFVGNNDFNYKEMIGLREFYPDYTFHFIDVWNGSHQWPEAAFMQNAFKWLLMKEMLLGLTENNQKVTQNWYDDYLAELNKQTTSDPEQIFLNYERGEAMFAGIIDITYLSKKKNDYNLSETYIKWQKKQMVANYVESKWITEFITGVNENKPMSWWDETLISLNTERQNEKNLTVINAINRAYEYLNLVCYLKANQALTDDNHEDLHFYTTLFGKVNNKNPDYYFFMSALMLKNNNVNEAVMHINKAIELGFTNVERLQTHEIFKPILSDSILLKVNKY